MSQDKYSTLLCFYVVFVIGHPPNAVVAIHPTTLPNVYVLQSINFHVFADHTWTGGYITTHSWIALLVARVNRCRTERWKIGTKRGRKSAPILLNERPKYMHWPRMESSLPAMPLDRSLSRTWRKLHIWNKITRFIIPTQQNFVQAN